MRITVGLHSRKTAYQTRTLFPIWNETLRLYVHACHCESIGACPLTPKGRRERGNCSVRSLKKTSRRFWKSLITTVCRAVPD